MTSFLEKPPRKTFQEFLSALKDRREKNKQKFMFETAKEKKMLLNRKLRGSGKITSLTQRRKGEMELV